MKDNGEITNKMFSVFIDTARSNSIIKFGGYDESAIAYGTRLTQLLSVKNDSWTFNVTEFNLAGAILPETTLPVA